MPQSGALAPYVVVNRDAAVAGVFSVDGLRGSVDLTTKYLTIANFNAYKTTTDGSISSINQSITALNTAVSNKAAKGANSDITSITGLTTALGIAYGGTGGKTAAEARTNLGLTTAATTSIGTEGARIPLLNGVNTWATKQTFNTGVTVKATYTDALLLESINPTIKFRETDRADAPDYSFVFDGGSFRIQREDSGQHLLSYNKDSNTINLIRGDFTDKPGTRSNLGLGSSATKDVGTGSDNVMQVGAFGFGGRPSAGFDNFDATQIVAGSTDNPAPGYNMFGMTILHAGTGYALQYAARNLSGFHWRTLENEVKNPWIKVYDTINTTKASDGTLKAASPVVKLFADGSFENNNESEGCTVTRLATGQYLIEGCQGLNSDAAWGGIDGGFDIPTDRNKQPLIWLDYEVNADGSVLVKTYHRTHPDAPSFARNEIEGISDGSPIDIPSDQFVSVRVEMPIDSIWNQKQKDNEQDYQDVTE